MTQEENSKIQLKAEIQQTKHELKLEMSEIKKDIRWGMFLLGLILGTVVKISFFTNH